jgi:hypothetical protein
MGSTVENGLELRCAYQRAVDRLALREERILRAFHCFAESNQKRMVELEGNEAAIRSRLGTLEGRLLEVEKRLNILPSS